MTRSTVKSVLAWTLQILLFAVFIMAGGQKITGTDRMVALYSDIGIGQWFRHFTAFVEIGSAVLLVYPRTSWIGAGLIVCTMICAAATHLFVIGGSFVPALILGLLAVCVLWLRRPAGGLSYA